MDEVDKTLTKMGYMKDESVTLNGLKNTVDVLELLHSQKDERIKQLEAEVQTLKWAIDDLRYNNEEAHERIDW